MPGTHSPLSIAPEAMGMLPSRRARMEGFTAAMSTFSGLRSVWMIEHCVCRKSSPIRTCRVISRTMSIGIPR